MLLLMGAVIICFELVSAEKSDFLLTNLSDSPFQPGGGGDGGYYYMPQTVIISQKEPSGSHGRPEAGLEPKTFKKHAFASTF